MSNGFHRIFDNVKIDFDAPMPLPQLMKQVEDADKEEDPFYSEYALNLLDRARDLKNAGAITEDQYHIINARYPFH